MKKLAIKAKDECQQLINVPIAIIKKMYKEHIDIRFVIH